MASYSPHALHTACQHKKKRPVRLSEKVQQASDSRKAIVAKTKSIVNKLTQLLTKTPPPTTFRFADLPDELQLYILSITLPGRICQVIEGRIRNRYEVYKRRNPFCLSFKTPRIPLALVCHKWKDMICQLRPKCFVVSEFGESKNLQLGFKYDCDTLLIPQWLLESPSISISNLSKVKLMIIAYTKLPNETTLSRIAELSENSIVVFIHAALMEYASTPRKIPLPWPHRTRRLSPFGPFSENDYTVKDLVIDHLDALAAESGKEYARIGMIRITSDKRAGCFQKGFWYWVGKSVKNRWIRREFKKKEARLDGELVMMREMALMFLNGDGELASWASSGLRKVHERHVRLMLHQGEVKDGK